MKKGFGKPNLGFGIWDFLYSLNKNPARKGINVKLHARTHIEKKMYCILARHSGIVKCSYIHYNGVDSPHFPRICEALFRQLSLQRSVILWNRFTRRCFHLTTTILTCLSQRLLVIYPPYSPNFLLYYLLFQSYCTHRSLLPF